MVRTLAFVLVWSTIGHAPVNARAEVAAPLCKSTARKGLSPRGAASFRAIYLEQDGHFNRLNERQQSVRAALEANVHDLQPDLVALERMQREELQLKLNSTRMAFAKMHRLFEDLSAEDRPSAVEIFYAEPSRKHSNDAKAKKVADKQEAIRMNLVKELCAVHPNEKKLTELRKRQLALELGYIKLTKESTARFLLGKSAQDQVEFWRSLYVRSGSKPRTMSVTN